MASGDVTSDSVVLWTRVHGLTAQGADVSWSISDGVATREGIVAAEAEHDHAVHVWVDGLEPGTGYEFRFTYGDAVVAGRTRTLPVAADRFRFAVACCSRWGWPGFELFDVIADESPDLLLHLGDSIYEVGETPPDGLITDPPYDCHSLEDYRRRHRQYRTDPSLRRLLASVPMLVIWDDHEVVDNAPDPNSAERRRAGQQAWAEWMPMGRTEEPGPLDRQVEIGGLVDLALVDSRFAGRTPSDVDAPGAEGQAPGAILNDEQWHTLTNAIERSTAPWFVFANQVQVGPMTLMALPAKRWPPWKRIVNPDQWDGFPEQRDRLYRLLDRASGRSVVLSGDLHSAWSRTLRDRIRDIAHEFTSPSISGVTYAESVRERLPIPAALLERWLRIVNRGIDHLDLHRHGHLICDVSPDRFTTTFVMHDGARHVVSLDR